MAFEEEFGVKVRLEIFGYMEEAYESLADGGTVSITDTETLEVNNIMYKWLE